MARINIDDELFLDLRWKSLVGKVGEANAFYKLYMLWRTAQKYWGSGMSLIPESVFKLLDSEVLVETDFAERRPEGIYARGSEERFDWYLQRKQASSAGGKKSAQARAQKYGTAQPSRSKPEVTPKRRRSDSEVTSKCSRSDSEANPNRTRTGLEPDSNLLVLAPVPALALDIKYSPSENIVAADAATPLTPRDLGSIWNEFKSPNQPSVQVESIKAPSKRFVWAKMRVTENPDRGYWVDVVKRLAKSPFCSGQNGQAWVANFEFLVRRDTHLKAIEGNYDDRQAGGPSTPLSQRPKEEQDAYWAKVFGDEASESQ